MADKGCLYIVAVPIGDPRDITLRALEVLRAADGVICEEYRSGSTLLKALGVQQNLIALNEHNEKTEAPAIVERLHQGQRLALVSDAGTPVFADPGHFLISLVTQAAIPVIPVPGPSSLMAALSVCDFDIRRFVFAGFLSRQATVRRRELDGLRHLGMPVVLMDAPYRLGALLEDVAAMLGRDRAVVLACDITLPSERIFRGTVAAVQRQTAGLKPEFVLIVR